MLVGATLCSVEKTGQRGRGAIAMADDFSKLYQDIRKYIARFPDRIIEWHGFCGTLPDVKSCIGGSKNTIEIGRDMERVSREIDAYILSLRIMMKQGGQMLDELHRAQSVVSDLLSKVDGTQKEPLTISNFQCVVYITSIEETIGVCEQQIGNLRQMQKALSLSHKQQESVVLANLEKSIQVSDGRIRGKTQ